MMTMEEWQQTAAENIRAHARGMARRAEVELAVAKAQRRRSEKCSARGEVVEYERNMEAEVAVSVAIGDRNAWRAMAAA